MGNYFLRILGLLNILQVKYIALFYTNAHFEFLLRNQIISGASTVKLYMIFKR